MLIGFSLLALVGLGIVLPALITRQIIVSNVWTMALALGVMIAIGGFVTLLSHLLYPSADPQTVFVRAFLIDGISLWILNIAPTTRPKKTTEEQ